MTKVYPVLVNLVVDGKLFNTQWMSIALDDGDGDEAIYTAVELYAERIVGISYADARSMFEAQCFEEDSLPLEDWLKKNPGCVPDNLKEE